MCVISTGLYVKSRSCIFADVGTLIARTDDDNVPLIGRLSSGSRRLTIVARLTIHRRSSPRDREDSRVSFIWLLSRYIALRSRNRGRVAPRSPRGEKKGQERDEDLRFAACTTTHITLRQFLGGRSGRREAADSHPDKEEGSLLT